MCRRLFIVFRKASSISLSKMMHLIQASISKHSIWLNSPSLKCTIQLMTKSPSSPFIILPSFHFTYPFNSFQTNLWFSRPSFLQSPLSLSPPCTTLRFMKKRWVKQRLISSSSCSRKNISSMALRLTSVDSTILNWKTLYKFGIFRIRNLEKPRFWFLLWLWNSLTFAPDSNSKLPNFWFRRSQNWNRGQNFRMVKILAHPYWKCWVLKVMDVIYALFRC